LSGAQSPRRRWHNEILKAYEAFRVFSVTFPETVLPGAIAGVEIRHDGNPRSGHPFDRHDDWDVRAVQIKLIGPAMDFERGTDRPGSDFRELSLSRGDPLLCAEACGAEARCQSWTYRSSREGRRCMLKSSVPAPVRHPDAIGSGETTYVSGVVERGTDRWGFDIATVPGLSNPDQCRAACASNGECRAWTFATLAAGWGSTGCWLKGSIPRTRSVHGLVSGVRGLGTSLILYDSRRVPERRAFVRQFNSDAFVFPASEVRPATTDHYFATQFGAESRYGRDYEQSCRDMTLRHNAAGQLIMRAHCLTFDGDLRSTELVADGCIRGQRAVDGVLTCVRGTPGDFFMGEPTGSYKTTCRSEVWQSNGMMSAACRVPFPPHTYRSSSLMFTDCRTTRVVNNAGRLACADGFNPPRSTGSGGGRTPPSPPPTPVVESQRACAGAPIPAGWLLSDLTLDLGSLCRSSGTQQPNVWILVRHENLPVGHVMTVCNGTPPPPWDVLNRTRSLTQCVNPLFEFGNNVMTIRRAH
jgi:hypothetical protein